MSGADAYTCKRCGAEFPRTASHTEIVRRDFLEVPRPATVERLCTDCWKSYVEEFLDRSFETQLEEYDTTQLQESS